MFQRRGSFLFERTKFLGTKRVNENDPSVDLSKSAIRSREIRPLIAALPRRVNLPFHLWLEIFLRPSLIIRLFFSQLFLLESLITVEPAA